VFQNMSFEGYRAPYCALKYNCIARLDRRTNMERFVRILTVFLWVAATLFVALLFAAGQSFEFLVGLLGSERLETFEAVLVGTVAVCSGLIAWYEFRVNNAEETEYGEWTGKAALYSTIFGITLFLSFLFIPVAFFDP
jgi:FtsH-binding integral membrane protein